MLTLEVASVENRPNQTSAGPAQEQHCRQADHPALGLSSFPNRERGVARGPRMIVGAARFGVHRQNGDHRICFR